MIVVRIAALGVISGVLILAVKKQSPELAMQLGMAAGAVILLMALDYLKEAVSYVRELAEAHPGMSDGVALVLKVVGIAYISETAVRSLVDAGQSAVAKRVELASKLVITVMTLPLIKQFADIVFSLAEEL